MIFILGLQFILLRLLFAWRYVFGEGESLLLGAAAVVEVAVFLAVYRKNVFTSPAETPAPPAVVFMRRCSFFVVAASLLAVSAVGFPLLAVEVNVAKTLVSQLPFLTRFFRVGGVFCVLWWSLYLHALPEDRASERARVKKFLVLLGTSLAAIGLFFGFKGYALMILIPLIFGLTGKKWLTPASVALALGAIAALLVATMVAEDVGLAGALDYIGARLSDVQLLGADLALEHSDALEGYWPVYDELRFAWLRVSGEREYASFQKELFRILHGSNELHMEVAVPSAVEYYVSLGGWGLALWGAVFTGLLLWIRRGIWRSRSLFRKAACLMLLITALDGALNGILVFKLLDFLVSSLVVGSIVSVLALAIDVPRLARRPAKA